MFYGAARKPWLVFFLGFCAVSDEGLIEVEIGDSILACRKEVMCECVPVFLLHFWFLLQHDI